MTNQWGAFEHLVWKSFKYAGLEDHRDFALALSGGLDSMVLLHVILKLLPDAKIRILYFHHGETEDPKAKQYRDEAENLVREAATKAHFLFSAGRTSEVLKSEEDFRNARWKFLRGQLQGAIPVTAHHLDDRLETMLLKLIRGTSSEGLGAFKVWNRDIFRPLLQLSKADLLDYAETNKLVWLEDPSNKDGTYLRNWLREKWLPELEYRLPGAKANFAKSLLKIAENSTEIQPFELSFNQSGLSRLWYVSLLKEDQLRALALFLKMSGIHKFTSGQLEEIRKRLDKNQKDITFDLVGKKWVINASQIMLE